MFLQVKIRHLELYLKVKNLKHIDEKCVWDSESRIECITHTLKFNFYIQDLLNWIENEIFCYSEYAEFSLTKIYLMLITCIFDLKKDYFELYLISLWGNLYRWQPDIVVHSCLCHLSIRYALLLIANFYHLKYFINQYF